MLLKPGALQMLCTDDRGVLRASHQNVLLLNMECFEHKVAETEQAQSNALSPTIRKVRMSSNHYPQH